VLDPHGEFDRFGLVGYHDDPLIAFKTSFDKSEKGGQYWHGSGNVQNLTTRLQSRC
jgi:hypothetical protein